MKQNVELTARVLIRHQGKFLVCWHKKKNYFFFPGGHIDFGESAKTALKREIKEELGVSIKKCSFIGTLENFYFEENQPHHEIILAFAAELNKLKLESKEDHIEFYLKTQEELIKDKVLPIILTKAVLRWLKDKKTFWISNFELQKKHTLVYKYGKTMG